MTQYIDKSALVAELESLRCTTFTNFDEGVNATVQILLETLDTLEVKEVDLEKAIDDYIYTHDGRKRLALELDWKCCNLTLKGGDEIIKFAKHFFELGLAVSNKA